MELARCTRRPVPQVARFGQTLRLSQPLATGFSQTICVTSRLQLSVPHPRLLIRAAFSQVSPQRWSVPFDGLTAISHEALARSLGRPSRKRRANVMATVSTPNPRRGLHIGKAVDANRPCRCQAFLCLHSRYQRWRRPRSRPTGWRCHLHSCRCAPPPGVRETATPGSRLD